MTPIHTLGVGKMNLIEHQHYTISEDRAEKYLQEQSILNRINQ